MSHKRARSASSKSPARSDDLKLIKGINRQIASRLQQAQITTFAQLAAITPANLVELIGDPEHVSEPRIVEQDWIGQAQELAAKGDRQANAETGAGLDNIGFVVDFFLDEEKRVSKIQVLQVKSGEGDEWEGWDERRLLDFFIRCAPLRLADKTSARALLAAQAEPVVAPASEAVPTPTTAAPELEEAHLPEQFALRSIELIPITTGTPSQLIKSGEPFNIKLAFDGGVPTPRPSAAPVGYTVSIFAKRWADNTRSMLAASAGVLYPSDEPLVITIAQPTLSPGVYRLEAALETTVTNQPATPATMAKSHILQVY